MHWMLHIFLLALTLATASPTPLPVVDENGAAVPQAQTVPLQGDRVLVRAPGYQTRILRLTPQLHVIVLQRALPVIASVRVATGSPQALHALPVAASVLDRAAIVSSSAPASDAVLRTLPGFDRTRSNSMFSNYGLMRVSFAGAGNDRGLVLADGIPAQDAFGGQIDWAAYPASSLQRAELLLGPGSALYGAGAVGGVLDLQTLSPPVTAGTPPSAELTMRAGTHVFSEQSASAAAWIAPQLSGAVSVHQQRLQYWDLPPAYQSPIDKQAQSNQAMAALLLRYALNAQDSLQAEVRDAWDDQFEGRQNYTFARTQQQNDLRYSHTTAQAGVSSIFYTRADAIVNIADKFPASPGVLRYVQNVPTNEDGISASWVVSGGPSTFELRSDARHVSGTSGQVGSKNVFQNSASGSQNLFGVAAQETWRGKRFEIVGGARLDSVGSYNQTLAAILNGTYTVRTPAARADAAVSPRIAARYDLSNQFAVRFSAGAGFRPAYLNELLRGFFIGPVDFLPNPGLVPERSSTVSAGVDQAAAGGRIAFDAFATTVSDAIMFRTIAPNVQIRSNVARTATNGYTLTYARATGTCARLSGSLTTQYARVTGGPSQLIGKRLQYVPQQSGSLSYSAQAGTVGIGLTMAYLGQTYADDLNTEPLGTSLVAGARVYVPLSGGETLDLSAENLTGARYLSSIDRYGIPALISAGLHFPLGQGNNQERGLRCTP
ncbi:MAG TPA: TonB-dependent receptor [Candidatus Baltobacteraceae bacterium]|jgi:outer membrane cobalamin receptor|nr:TonB-dependent receptor [Candidatus Baltobacteraceae bacterium]